MVKSTREGYGQWRCHRPVPLWTSELESSALILWEEWKTPLAQSVGRADIA